MVRIRQVVKGRRETTLHVEGRIVSDWVSVLEEECRRVLQEPSRRLRLDFSAVTFVDRRGVVTLRWLMTEGVAIANSPKFIEALLKGDGTS
jgi:anti-anti-sigma regulatory factor